MATGFIYTVSTLTKDYVQQAFCNVPTQFGDRLYWRVQSTNAPRINPGDYVFGVSPSGVSPPAESCSLATSRSDAFREAYERFPDLRGPEGPIHVRPISHSDLPAHCSYAHIPDAMHADRWQAGVPGLGCVLRLFSPRPGVWGVGLAGLAPRLMGKSSTS